MRPIGSTLLAMLTMGTCACLPATPAHAGARGPAMHDPRTAVFQALEGKMEPRNLHPESGDDAHILAFVGGWLAADAAHPDASPAPDPSESLVGTGLVREALDPDAADTIARLLARPEVAPWLADARVHRAQLGLLIRYARARVGAARVARGLSPSPPLAAVQIPADLREGLARASRPCASVTATPTPGTGDTASHAEELARLSYTLGYFKVYPSLGGTLHKAVMRWLIDSHRLERFGWWNLMNRRLYEDLGHTLLWKAYEQTFAHPIFEPLREKRYLAAHNADLDSGKILARSDWHALPLTEKLLADAIMDAAYAGGDVLRLLPLAARGE